MKLQRVNPWNAEEIKILIRKYFAQQQANIHENLDTVNNFPKKHNLFITQERNLNRAMSIKQMKIRSISQPPK